MAVPALLQPLKLGMLAHAPLHVHVYGSMSCLSISWTHIHGCGLTLLGRGVDEWVLELVVVGLQGTEQVEDLVLHLHDPRRRTVHLFVLFIFREADG